MFPTLIVIPLLALVLIASYGLQNACACQCARQSPERYAQSSDVIFLGRVISKVEARAPEVGSYVTFDVLKSWKGVDTKTVTIHTGDGSSCGSFPFRLDDPERLEFLVYGTQNFGEIFVTLCGGTISRNLQGVDFNSNPYMNVDLSIEYLDNTLSPASLRQGHTWTGSVIFPLQILGCLFVAAGAAFAIIRWR